MFDVKGQFKANLKGGYIKMFFIHLISYFVFLKNLYCS